jgi:CO/xanthine dehydrogenase FAD-binding subunit
VDLQSLGLNTLEVKGKKIQIGATVTMQQLLDFKVVQALKSALRHEATYNIRQVATIAGALVVADGRSPLATALLALDAELTILPEGVNIGLGNYLPDRVGRRPNHLITRITIPNNIELAYQYVARSPADLPIVCVAVTRWPSGRTRIALGGFGSAPLLVMDGPESEGAESAARDACHEAGDQWASAAYRSDVAGILVRRCIQTFSS